VRLIGQRITPTVEQVDRLVVNAPAMAGRIFRFMAETAPRQDSGGFGWGMAVQNSPSPASSGIGLSTVVYMVILVVSKTTCFQARPNCCQSEFLRDVRLAL
jgi:hypothetical protein